jgi:hypothetical protein
MATVAVNGTLYGIFSTSGTLATATASGDKIYACRSASIKYDASIEDASSKESGGWWDGMPGQKGVTLDFGGVWDEAGVASALTATEIIAHIISGNAARKFAFVPAALGTTIPGWMGMGFFQNIGVNADNEKPAEFSGSIKGTGAWEVFTA